METPLQKIKDFCQDQENEIPDPTAQLQADKAELLEALKYANRMLKNSKDAMYDNVYIESLIQKMKQ